MTSKRASRRVKSVRSDASTTIMHPVMWGAGEEVKASGFFGETYVNELKAGPEGTRIQVEYAGGFRMKQFIIRLWEDEATDRDD